MKEPNDLAQLAHKQLDLLAEQSSRINDMPHEQLVRLLASLGVARDAVEFRRDAVFDAAVRAASEHFSGELESVRLRHEHQLRDVVAESAAEAHAVKESLGEAGELARAIKEQLVLTKAVAEKAAMESRMSYDNLIFAKGSATEASKHSEEAKRARSSCEACLIVVVIINVIGVLIQNLRG